MIRGVKCLVFNQDGKILLVRLSYAHQQWTLPGGGVENGETFIEAAHRELEEETGVHPKELEFFAEYEGVSPAPHPVQCFVAHVSRPTLKSQEGEISDIGWFSSERLPTKRSDRVDKILNLFAKNVTFEMVE